LTAGTLLSAEANGRSDDGWLAEYTPVDANRQRLPNDLFVASDAAAADIDVLLPPGFAGDLVLTRLDLGVQQVEFDIGITDIAARNEAKKNTLKKSAAENAPELNRIADRGHSALVGVPRGAYDDLVALARAAATRLPPDPAAKAHAHDFVSAVIGRQEHWDEIATRSEPVVMFIGLAGLSRIILVDSVAWPMVVTGSARLAEPWQTTFERAEHFWAVYVEEESAPFFTSIDSDFRKSGTPEEHDEFDPQGIVRRESSGAGNATLRIRLGYKRFRIPGALNVARVTFSRQSSSYGLRQWSRAFTKYGSQPVRFAGAVVVTVPVIERRDFATHQIYVDDALKPTAYSLEEDISHQPIFAALATRFPHLKASAEQAPIGWPRFWRSLTPEPMVGRGVPMAKHVGAGGQSFLVAASWPVIGDRVHFVFGRVWLQEPAAKNGYTVPSRIPVDQPLDEIREFRGAWKSVAGLSVDLARTWW